MRMKVQCLGFTFTWKQCDQYRNEGIFVITNTWRSLWLKKICTGGDQTRGHGLINYTVETPNPKSRFYWCLTEFIDWRYGKSCWYFWSALYTIAPLTFSLSSSPPFPVWISILYTRMRCVRGGHRWERGFIQIKHLPQSSFTGPFGIAFYQSNLSTLAAFSFPATLPLCHSG